MFWTAVLPAQITLGIIFGIVAVWIYAAPKHKKRRGPVFVWGLLSSILLFIPIFTIVMIVSDNVRFGVFHFPDVKSINDVRVHGDLPDAAINIKVEKTSDHHLAKYTITKGSLETWHEDFWKMHDSTIPRTQIDLRESNDAESFARLFGHLKWSLPDDAEVYHGPVSPRGGSYRIWYSSLERIAYQYSAYW